MARFAALLPLLAACSATDPEPGSATQQESAAGSGATSQPGASDDPEAATNQQAGAAKPAGQGNYTGNASLAAMNGTSDGLDADVSGDAAVADPAATPGAGLAPVLLRSAGSYVILAQSAITNVPTSAITGDVGISPAAASSITGFPFTNAGDKLTTPQVVGNVFAADLDTPTPSDLITAIGDMQAAYIDAAGRTAPDFLNLGDGSIGGLTLAPGLYNWTSVVGVPTDVTLSGSANDVWIFQISGDLTLSPGTAMILSGGAQPKNIIWQVAGFVNLGTTSHAEGIMLSKTAINLETGSSINGRLLAQTAVTLDQNTISEP